MRPTIVLSNGVRVCNFSSPHPFQFEDGSVLPACNSEQSQETSLSRSDEERPFPGLVGVKAVVPKFTMTDSLIQILEGLQFGTNIDVIIVPFPVLEALRASGRLEYFTKVATISIKDRESKTAFINRFCR